MRQWPRWPALDKVPNKKQNLLLFLSGLAMLSAPALLIGLSPKYQQPGQVDWRHGYIPQTVESFGVGLMALARAGDAAAPGARQELAAGGRAVLYGLLAVCMAGSVVWQRAATARPTTRAGAPTRSLVTASPRAWPPTAATRRW